MKKFLPVAVLLVVLAAPVGGSHFPLTEPDPSLSPQDVVSIQIEALQHNVRVEGDVAQVDVILQSKDGQYLGYRFMLSRQHDNQYEGSWMTDSVSRFNIVSL